MPLPAHRSYSLVLLTFAQTLSGCATGHQPRNLPDAAWMQQQGTATPAPVCAARPAAQPELPSSHRRNLRDALQNATLLGPGDRVRVRLSGDEDQLSGVYIIGTDGVLTLPGVQPVRISGLTEGEARDRLAAALVAIGMLSDANRFFSISQIEMAPVSVAVTGAVFDPGMHSAGERSPEARVGQKEGLVSGDANTGRTIAAALRAAGGVRPDANVSQIYLIRGAYWDMIDLAPAIAGTAAGDVELAAGDRVIVASTGCFDPALVRPTLVTAPGIRVYMSNLTRPAGSNSASAINKDATSLPYGTRLLQGLVAMNCVGGSAMNAGRQAVLISRNPVTGRSIVIQRDVEHLVRDADRDELDPYLMPGDALACYDSRWVNLQDAVSLAGSAAGIATPAILLRNASH